MNWVQPNRTRALLGVVLALVASLLVLDSWQPASAAPAVGKCRNLTVSDLNNWSNSDDPVDCRGAHTAQTYAVVKLDKDLKKWSNANKQNRGTRYCAARFDNALGTDWATRMSTAYTFVYFYPTKAEMDDRQYWLRCDVVLMRGGALSQIPRAKSPLIGKSSVNAKIRLCADGQARIVTCDASSRRWRLAKVLYLATKTAPNPNKMRSIAEARCPKFVGSKRFLYVYRSAEWSAGNRFYACMKRI